MSLYTGVTGKLAMKKGATTSVDLIHMANWSVNLKKDINEVVSFGQDYKEKIPSIKDWSGSADGKTDFDTAGGQKMLLDAFEDGSVLEGSFYLNEDTFFVGNCYVESLSIKHAADGSADISISVSGSGAIALTVPGA